MQIRDLGGSNLAARRKDILDEASELLRSRLHVGKRMGVRPVTRSVKYRSPPLIMEPREDNLHLVRMPPLKFDPDTALVVMETLFDKVVNPDLNTMYGWKRILKSELGSTAIKRCSTDEEILVTIFWMFSQIPGWRLDFDDRNISLQTHEGVRGLIDGKIVSKFPWQFEAKPVNPREFLTSVVERKNCRNWDMVIAYNAARWVAPKLMDVLAILYESLTAVEFKSLMVNQPTLPAFKSRKMEKIIFEDKDPYTKLFRLLVPRWLNITEFEARMGVPNLRVEELDMEQRSVLFNKFVALPFVQYKL